MASGAGEGMLVVEQFESLAVFGVATVDFGLPNTPLKAASFASYIQEFSTQERIFILWIQKIWCIMRVDTNCVLLYLHTNRIIFLAVKNGHIKCHGRLHTLHGVNQSPSIILSSGKFMFCSLSSVEVLA